MQNVPNWASIELRTNATNASLRKTALRLSPRRQAALALAAIAALGSAATHAATVDLWTNPAGGNYEDGTNWNTVAEPTSTGVGTFNLNSSAGYAVNVLANETALGLNVQTDNLTMNLNGKTLCLGPSGGVGVDLNVGDAAGQTGSLTLSTPPLPSTDTTDVQVDMSLGVAVGSQGGKGQLILDGARVYSLFGGLAVGGNSGTGSLIVKNGGSFSAPVDAGGFLLGVGGAGSATLNNGAITVDQSVEIGTSGGTATISLTQSQITATIGNIDVGQATINLNGSTLTTDSNELASTITFGGGTSVVTATNGSQIVSSDGEIVIGALSGSSTINASGTGTFIGASSAGVTALILTVGEGATGVVHLSAGASMASKYTLNVGGNSGTGIVSVSDAGSKLESAFVTIGADASGAAGNGNVTIENNATMPLMPLAGLGDSDDLMTIDPGGTLTIETGGRVSTRSLLDKGALMIGLGGIASSANGQMNVQGPISLGGTLSVFTTGGFEPKPGDTFDLFTFSTRTGTFTSINLPANIDGTWDTSQLYKTGTISVVPEPASAGVLLVLAPLTSRPRRRRTRARH